MRTFYAVGRKYGDEFEYLMRADFPLWGRIPVLFENKIEAEKFVDRYRGRLFIVTVDPLI